MDGGMGQSEQDDEMGAVCHRHVSDAFHRRVVVPVQLGNRETVSVCDVFCPRLSIGLSNSWKDKKLRQALVGPCELATQDVAGPLQSWQLDSRVRRTISRRNDCETESESGSPES